jgi:heme/copper-type cytochrome/quinol oxidase subunit 2
VNKTNDTLQNLTVDLSASGDLKICERPQNYTLAPGASKTMKANVKVSNENVINESTKQPQCVFWLCLCGTLFVYLCFFLIVFFVFFEFLLLLLGTQFTITMMMICRCRRRRRERSLAALRTTHRQRRIRLTRIALSLTTFTWTSWTTFVRLIALRKISDRCECF